jgi:PAS domain S-box-containing protein
MSSQALPALATHLFRYLFEQASIGIAVEDLEGKILLANPALCSILGYTEQELCTMSCSEFANPEDSQDDWALFEQLRAGVIDHYSLEKRYIKKDGVRIWGRLNVSLLNEGDGGTPLVFAFVEEITERKFVEQELIRSNERFRLAVEASKSVGWEWDLKTGRDSWFGDLQTMFGIPSDTFVGRAEDFYSYVHPDDREMVAKAVADARQTRQPYAAEFRGVRRDGMLRWVFATGKFYYGTNGDAEQMLGMATDITERKQAEEALRESEQRLGLAIQAGRMYAFDWNVATDVIVRSKESIEILNWEKAENDTGRAFCARVHPDDLALYTATAETSLTPENPTYQIIFRTFNPAGSVIWLEESGRAFFDAQGEMVRVTGMMANVTERKRSEEALRKSEERFRLAAAAGKMFAYEWDAATDKIVRTEGVLQVLGVDAGPRTTGQELLAMVPAQDRPGLIAAIVQLSPKEPHLRISYRMVRSDGGVIWVERTSCAYFDEHGRMLRIVGMVADITERKRAEERLREYEKAIEGSEQMIAVVDREYRYLIANGKFLKIRNLTKEQVVGHLVPEVLNKRVFEDIVKEKMDECFAGKAAKFEMRNTYPEIGERDLFVSYFPIEGASGVDRAVCVLQDITEQKRTEKALKKSE